MTVPPFLRRSARGMVLPALLAVGACRAEPVPSLERKGVEAAAQRTAWRPLGEWSGTGELQTGSFDVTTGSLRLRWEAGDAEASGLLRVTLHSAISGRPLRTLVDVEGPGVDTVEAAASPRVAYLLVESEGIDWRIALEEGVLGAPD